ncbi:hypothetical protein Poli38472_001974 [Pythium oligandrum]|uniref:Phosphatidate cytidylyltransferase n=1 Tax=Pythium oligandrum TaxID=41045 RepID=A0A8K1CX25_PYTOL|nr:hypothetical protein Poli38472_001974 [Pythium oligandrum]|eukprot:TMW69818.1 hypothetical protein Poli38472_001974 [Pythium oligandrum]
MAAVSTSPFPDATPDILHDAARHSQDSITDDTWTITLGPWKLQLSNGAQRFLSALVLAPLITFFLWSSPVFATTTVCAVVAAVSCYEYAWIAHRIHLRFIVTLEKYEEANTVVHPSCSSTGSGVSYQSNEPTYPVEMTPPTALERSQGQPPVGEVMEEEVVAFLNKSCAVTPVAARFFCGREWLVAIIVSVFGTIISSFLFRLVSSTDAFYTVNFGGYRMYYAVISSFATWMCACLTPDWKYGTLLVFQQELFTGLTLYSMRCPINDFSCDNIIHPAMFLMFGIVGILVLRLLTSTGPIDYVVHIMLDILGFFYVIGTLFFIVSFVDVDRKATYRKLIIALLYVVWAADSGAYFVGQVFDYFNYKNYHPLASHISPRKDYEGTLIAVFVGMGTMFLASDVLSINGTIAEKLFFSATAVIVGRIGDLFQSLLKRAALVKHSGILIPGHGGVLDRIDALMFASIVFSRYFGAIAD